jgi:hypothetical protein
MALYVPLYVRLFPNMFIIARASGVVARSGSEIDYPFASGSPALQQGVVSVTDCYGSC